MSDVGTPLQVLTAMVPDVTRLETCSSTLAFQRDLYRESGTMTYSFDPLYLVWLTPGLVLALWAQWSTQRAWRQGEAVASTRHITGT